ncbi:hypothetical protein [Gilliamella apicola]|uniref:Uncharacterized protein n=1 Tax=Gilliamella apicola TaxID=1196095 RepID=A0A2V4E6T1_9GAMM|nr:hypothetical protein [Gilliamella apicola]PXZ06114.1 hypothetical protein DKK79_05475 [Gilliamella apicola]
MGTSWQKLGFTVGGIYYSQEKGNIISDQIKKFNGSYQLSDFVIQPSYLMSNLDRSLNYFDENGDIADDVEPFTLNSNVSYEWYDAEGEEISRSQYGSIIGCGSGFKMPLQLKIHIGVKPNSKYGVPRQGDFSDILVKYKIASNPELCYVAPNSLKKFPQFQWLSFNYMNEHKGWNNTTLISRRSAVGGGYSSDYVPNYGFKVNPSGERFPTTGFPGASFHLVVSGAQTDYEYSFVGDSTGVSVDENGKVLLERKPNGSITVQIKSKLEPSFKVNYTFNPTRIWVYPYNPRYPTGDYKTQWDNAITICSEDNLPSYQDLTNAPMNPAILNMDFLMNNGYTRAIGQGVLPEWGYTIRKAYPESRWSSVTTDRYWTKDIDPNNPARRVDVDASSGHLGVDSRCEHCPDFIVCMVDVN